MANANKMFLPMLLWKSAKIVFCNWKLVLSNGGDVFPVFSFCEDKYEALLSDHLLCNSNTLFQKFRQKKIFFSLPEFSKEALELTKLQESTLQAKYGKEMKVK